MKKARSQAATQVQETSWQTSTANEGIPTYNANADPLCPLAMARKFNMAEKLRADASYDTSRSPKAKGPRSPGKGLGHLPPMMRASASMPTLPISDEDAAAAAARAANGTAPDRAGGPRGEPVLSKTPLAGPGLPQMDSTYGTAWVQGTTSVRPGSVDPSTLGPVRGGAGSVGGANGTTNMNMSTEVASIISWQESDAGIELECIRCVVRREKLLQDLTDLVSVWVEGVGRRRGGGGSGGSLTLHTHACAHACTQATHTHAHTRRIRTLRAGPAGGGHGCGVGARPGGAGAYHGPSYGHSRDR